MAGVLAAGVNYLHEQYYSQNGWKEYSSYTTQRSEYMDYAHLSYEEGEEIYTECGWSEALYNVVEGWFFMDPRVNQETFAEINAYTKTKMEKSKENLTEQIANISSGLWNTGNRIKIEVIYLAIAGFMILCMALAGKDWRAFLQLIMGYGACVILYIYLCRDCLLYTSPSPRD